MEVNLRHDEKENIMNEIDTLQKLQTFKYLTLIYFMQKVRRTIEQSLRYLKIQYYGPPHDGTAIQKLENLRSCFANIRRQVDRLQTDY